MKANAEYFDSVGTHVVMGRGISAQDTSTAPAVAVVNQAFVKTVLQAGREPDRAALRIAWTRSRRAITRLSAWWRTRPTPACAGRTTRCTSFRMMQRPASDKDPIEKDDVAVCRGDCAGDGAADERYGDTGAADAGGHQSEPDGGEVPDLRRSRSPTGSPMSG